MESSDRKILLAKLPKAYRLFKELIKYYGTSQLVQFSYKKKSAHLTSLLLH